MSLKIRIILVRPSCQSHIIKLTNSKQNTFFLMSEILFLHIDGKMGGTDRSINNSVEEKNSNVKNRFP